MSRFSWSRTCLAASLAALALLAPAWGENVKDLGPAPITSGNYTGRVAAIACSPTNANRIYVAGADGGVWRTTDGGVNWTPLTDQLPTTSCGALTLDPADENTIYLGSGEANFANHSRYGLGIFKSTDGGDNWTQLAADTFSGRCISRLIVSYADSQVLYAAVTRAGGFPEMAAAKNHPQRTGPLGVFRSLDGGVSWSQLAGGLPTANSATDLAQDPVDPNTLYAAIGHIFGSPLNGIYKTTDGGATWTALGGGLPTANVGRISVAIAPTNRQRLYALYALAATSTGANGGTQGAFRSDNGGATWTSLTIASDFQATYGWYESVVRVSNSDPNTVFLGGLDVIRSSNAGGTFSYISPPHVDIHALTIDAAGGLWSGDDGGVHYTNNAGASWIDRNTGLGLIQCYAGISSHPANDNLFFAGVQDNGSNSRTTDTRNWTTVLGGDGGWTQLDQLTPTRVFVEFQGAGSLYRSTNSGGSFSASSAGISTSDRNSFEAPYVLDPTNSNLAYYGTYRIYRSTNGGVNWAAISGDITTGSGAIRCLAIARSNPTVLYAATNDGKVLVSTNSGVNFTTLLTNNPGWPRVTREIMIDPNNAANVYLAGAVFGVDHVRYSTDQGQSWVVLDGSLPDVPVNAVAADARFSPAILYAGTDAGLLRSLDSGQTWRKFGRTVPNTPIVDLQPDLLRDRLIVATQGRGAWQINGLIPGDLNADGHVDLGDLAALLANYGCTSGCNGDADGDGNVDLSDIALLLGNYGLP